MTRASTTTQRKADANRRNASRSTGPKTPQGKAWSRLNALKHGILASQAVIATIEGCEERALFETMADGLANDFAPVGAYEQLLVQEIAACFWRKRRLLMFENRAAFEVKDRYAQEIINHPKEHATRSPLYQFRSRLTETSFIYPAAGLNGITLPSEADTARVIRYEAAITRIRERAHAALKASQVARRRNGGSASTARRHPAAIDHAAKVRNARHEHAAMLSPWASIRSWDQLDESVNEVEKALAELRAEQAKNGETKPKDPANPDPADVIEDILSGNIDPEEWLAQQTKPDPGRSSGG